ncbi:MAG: ATPase [Bacteroidetes bacterium 24-39-8]|jgi:NadR type nicotinamide-nucleotide adenylyltransferase|nr:MAG: ATPase [Sphingobacteriia bacterium 35-40-8]OYZ51576.1 MAG: ATPase [Bacteroidetes bacterium 24-39-8]OZA62959.1 MAG: ATPase [Sphingobacteriia bacterium 39-39-8]HQR94461.1 ATP-binding protein [Sediminibacterium sp.]HQS55578.1 ATP-binding protein [Sediminibacterium sp.]
MSLKKVVVIGPESTGKSSLCAELAEHFSAKWCPEYAREHLTVHGKAYSYDDLLTIAQKQLAQEDRFTNEALNNDQELLFIDTDMYVMKVWCEYVFQKCHHYILEQITQRQYDLYLLCDTDLPWVQDELREYPADGPRKELFQIYKDLLINQSIPFVIINGNYQERLQEAIEAVEQLQGQLV